MTDNACERNDLIWKARTTEWHYLFGVKSVLDKLTITFRNNFISSWHFFLQTGAFLLVWKTILSVTQHYLWTWWWNDNWIIPLFWLMYLSYFTWSEGTAPGICISLWPMTKDYAIWSDERNVQNKSGFDVGIKWKCSNTLCHCWQLVYISASML